MNKSHFNPDLVAADLLNHAGLAAIWQLHLSAALVYRKGDASTAWLLIDVADAVERMWLRRSKDNRLEQP